MKALRLAGWLLAYALYRALAWVGASRKRATVAVCVAVFIVLFAVVGHRPSSSLRLATYNIQEFGRRATDEARLAELLRGLDADVIAVQEIQDPDRFERLLGAIRAPGREYALALSQCGGKRAMHVGFVYDSRRVKLAATREFPELDPDGEGTCHDGDRPGLLGDFLIRGKRFGLLVVHLAAGREQVAARQAQWERALSILRRQRAEGGPPMGIIGDVNSTGFLDDDQGERTLLLARLQEARMRLLTDRLGCSEYYEKPGGHL